MRSLQLIRSVLPWVLAVLPTLAADQQDPVTDPAPGFQPTPADAIAPGSARDRTQARRRFVPLAVERLELPDGRVFEQVRILSESALFVTLRHAGGMAQVEKALLPPDLQDKYPEDLKAAERDRARTEAERSRREDQQAKRTRARVKQRVERAAAQQGNAEAERARSARDEADAYRLAQRELERYFRTQWTPGNNSIFVTGVDVNLEDLEAAQNWPGRWNVRGTAFIEYYLSSGDSFSRNNLRFSGEMIQERNSVKLDIRAR